MRLGSQFKSAAALVLSLGVVGTYVALHGNSDSIMAVMNNQAEASPSSVTKSARQTRKLNLNDVASLVGEPASESSLWKNDFNVVHVVNTRFMQHQAQLTSLLEARMDLFETFTLPSIKSQTNQEFLWMIWTDPTLSTEAVQELKNQLPANAVLVGGVEPSKNSNLRNMYGSSWSELESALLHGDAQLLQDYFHASQTHVFLETQLDADDALAHSFIESIQTQAAVALGREGHVGDIHHFCPEHHVEWRYYSPDDVADSEQGELLQFENKQFCIFSGLTRAFHLEEEKSRNLHQMANCIEHEHVPCIESPIVRNLFEDRALTYTHPPPPPPTPDVCYEYVKFDFDDREWGEYIYDEYANSHGIRFAATNWGGTTCYTPINGVHSEWGAIRIFNTATPVGPYFVSNDVQCSSGDGDDDLATPSSNPSNNVAMGHAAIVQELKDSSSSPYTDECPDDCTGSKMFIQFTLDDGPTVNSITFLDIDSSGERPYVYVYDKDGTVVMNGARPPVTGNKGKVEFMINKEKVRNIYIKFPGSGAITDIDYVWCPPVECQRRLRLLPQDQDEEMKQVAQHHTMPNSLVLLARTPTAAGMKNVLPNKKGGGVLSRPLNTYTSSEGQEIGWSQMEHEFGVNKKSVKELRQRFEGKMDKILVDAFAGQCTKGFSCKESTKRALGYLLDNVYQNKDAQN